MSDKKQTKVVDVLKRDNETFYSFGITPDEKFLIIEAIEITTEVIKSGNKLDKIKKTRGKKEEPTEKNVEFIGTNKHVLYVWECGMDGEFVLRSQIGFQTSCQDFDNLTNIWCIE